MKPNEDFQTVHSDFLSLKEPGTKFCPYKLPEGKSSFDAVFLSPPWGGPGYWAMDKYSLEYIFPEFKEIVRKAVKFSPNLMFFLPKNTSIT